MRVQNRYKFRFQPSTEADCGRQALAEVVSAPGIFCVFRQSGSKFDPLSYDYCQFRDRFRVLQHIPPEADIRPPLAFISTRPKSEPIVARLNFLFLLSSFQSTPYSRLTGESRSR